MSPLVKHESKNDVSVYQLETGAWKTQTVKDINRLSGEKTIHTIDSVGVFDYCAA